MPCWVLRDAHLEWQLEMEGEDVEVSMPKGILRVGMCCAPKRIGSGGGTGTEIGIRHVKTER